MKITHKDFEKVIVDSVSSRVADIINSLDMRYDELTDFEKKDAFSKIKEISENDLKKSGKHRVLEWESGWMENRNLLKENQTFESVLPKYFGKFPYLRFDGRLVKQISKDLEYNMLCSLEYHYFEKYLSDAKNILEFGCGTGHNLFRARRINDHANLTGLDWAESSQQILNELNASNILKCDSRKFDFFEPDYSFCLKEESAIYTIAALEQIGSSHDSFISYILANKPKVCLHIEPIIELLSPQESFLDEQCVLYCKKRNYLQGFLPKLRELENDGKIEILETKRTNIGSFLIEGYSVIAWRPL